jgi:diamine N-acetyltransferase
MSETTPHPEPTADSVVTLREVTQDTLRDILRLKVTPEQDQFVAPNAVSVAEAYFERERAWFRAIYADETPVGFLMLYDDPEKPTYYLWRFMIDARYQRHGFGRRALELLIDHVRTRPNASELLLSYVPAEGSPQPFYARLGFVDTGVVHDGENEMKLVL